MKFFRILTIILTISLCVFIFFLSSETAMESSATSRGLIAKFLSFFVEDFYELSQAEQNALCAPFQFIVRKSAHFLAYFSLGILSCLSIITYKKPALKFKFLISALFCLLYAISDEIHQYFVPGRSCEIRDVCIDFCGTLLALSIIALFTVKKNKKTEKVKMRKKDLIETSQSLFKKNETLLAQRENLKAENQKLLKEIDNLKSSLENLANEIELLKKPLPEKAEVSPATVSDISAVAISPDQEYGSKIIGQIVVDATSKCNFLTSQESIGDRELVNLILGRTEVAKAEILKIVSSDLTLEDKKSKMDNEKTDAIDYFGSVLAQKN